MGFSPWDPLHRKLSNHRFHVHAGYTPSKSDGSPDFRYRAIKTSWPLMGLNLRLQQILERGFLEGTQAIEDRPLYKVFDDDVQQAADCTISPRGIFLTEWPYSSLYQTKDSWVLFQEACDQLLAIERELEADPRESQ